MNNLPTMKQSLLYRYSYIWVTLIFFLGSLVLHFVFAWHAYVNEQQGFGLPIEMSEYWIQTLRDMFENWQSEFLQLIWQVLGLAYLLYIGSPQSKEGDERKEEKLDAILRSINKKEGEDLIEHLDKKYPRS
jgi:hypothetical protein